MLTLFINLNLKPVAKTNKGKKKVYVEGYTYKSKSGKTVKVPTHYRSTPN